MAGKFKLVEAFAELTVRDGRFRAAMTRARASMGKVQASMNAVAATSRRMLLVGGLAIAGLVRTAATFEKSMAIVLARTGATESQFKKLQETAKELGKTTIFTASQAAEAMGKLAQSGQTVNQIMESVGPTLNLATAASLDLAGAASVVTGILGGMGLTTDQLARTVDVLVTAENTSRVAVTSLAQEMKFFASTANTAGLELEETVAILETIAQGGIIQGAGRGARAIFAQIAKGGKQVTEVFSELGISLRDPVTNAIRPIADIIDEFKAATRETDRLGLSMRAFDRVGGAAFAAMITKGGDTIRTFKRLNKEGIGAADRIAEIMRGVFIGRLKLFRSRIEDVAIVIGTMLMPVFDRMIAGMDQLIVWFQSLTDAQRRQIRSWTVFGFALLGTLVLLPKIILALRGLFAVIKFMLVPTITLGGVFAAVGIAIAILAAAWLTAKANGESFTDTLKNMAEQAGLTTLELLGLGSALGDIEGKEEDRAKEIGAAVGAAERAVAKAEGVRFGVPEKKKQTPAEKAATESEAAIGEVQAILNRVKGDLKDKRKELRTAVERLERPIGTGGFKAIGDDIKFGLGKIVGLEDPVKVLGGEVSGLKATEENLTKTLERLRGRQERVAENLPSSLDISGDKDDAAKALRVGGGEAVSAAQLQSRIQSLTQSKAEAQRDEMIDAVVPMNEGIQDMVEKMNNEGIPVQGDIVGVFGAR